jgi:hypothetical protein
MWHDAMALSLIVWEFAGYGYRRVTHALKRGGGPGQSQARLARDARRVAVVPVKTAVCANDGLASSLSGLSQSVSDGGIDGSQSGMGGRYYIHSLAQLFCRAFLVCWMRTHGAVWAGSCQSASIPSWL